MKNDKNWPPTIKSDDKKIGNALKKDELTPSGNIQVCDELMELKNACEVEYKKATKNACLLRFLLSGETVTAAAFYSWYEQKKGNISAHRTNINQVIKFAGMDGKFKCTKYTGNDARIMQIN